MAQFFPPQSTTGDRHLLILEQAAQAFIKAEIKRPTSQQMVEALVKTEQAAKANRVSLPIDSLLGTWRLCFTADKASRQRSGTVEGKGRYVPRWIKAHLTFSQPSEPFDLIEPASDSLPQSQPLAIANQLQLGALLLRLTGPASYLGRKNLLAFDLTQMDIQVFGVTLYSGGVPGRRSSQKPVAQQSIGKLPFFAFITATEGFIAARGRGGGLALWVCDRQS